MLRGYAVSFGAIAMSVVLLRGAFRGELASSVTKEAIVMMVLFTIAGSVVTWIADQLVRDTVETTFRRRVDWYRSGLIEAGYENETPVDGQ
jgi:hypothetical protein